MHCKIICVLAIGMLACGGARAQVAVKLWPDLAPGSGHWNWKEKVERDVVGPHGEHFGTVIEDVVTPTLTPYLPAAGTASGVGVIIAPGGGCIALTITPSIDTARWLQRHGVAAFVLKYRLKRKLVQGMPKYLNEDIACRWGVADAIQALKVVRAHAMAWKVSPDRIGIIGFSAGGYIASKVLVQQNAALRPDFAGLIYGAPFADMPAIPAKLPDGYKPAEPALPPIFMAWAQDDTDASSAMMRFYRLLKAEGYRPEAHVYAAGGHGFALLKPDTSSAHWLQEFYWWLESEGFTRTPRHGTERAGSHARGANPSTAAGSGRYRTLTALGCASYGGMPGIAATAPHGFGGSIPRCGERLNRLHLRGVPA